MNNSLFQIKVVEQVIYLVLHQILIHFLLRIFHFVKILQIDDIYFLLILFFIYSSFTYFTINAFAHVKVSLCFFKSFFIRFIIFIFHFDFNLDSHFDFHFDYLNFLNFFLSYFLPLFIMKLLLII